MSNSDKHLTELLGDDSFVRWIRGGASREENEKWDQWETEHPSHTQLKKEAVLLYRIPFRAAGDTDAGEQLTRLNRRIDTLQHSPRGARRTKRYWLTAAAVFLLAAMVAMSTFFLGNPLKETEEIAQAPLFKTIEIDYGEKGILKTSDGSEITLNANSTLRYNPDQFRTSQAEVWLEGEAYFSIEPGGIKGDRSFTVHTPQGNIHVTGTTFNVNTRFDRTHVVLVEGAVNVSLQNTDPNIDKNALTMKPGEHALLSPENDTIEIQGVDPSLYTAWLEGRLSFNHTPLQEIMKTIEATYGIHIEVRDRSLLDQQVSGSLNNPDLNTLFLGLEKTLSLDIQKKNERMYLIAAQTEIENEQP